MEKRSFNIETGEWEVGEYTPPTTEPTPDLTPVDDNPTSTPVTNPGENFTGYKSDLVKITDQKGATNEESGKTSGRPWAVVNNATDSLSLHFIFEKIITGYGYEAEGLPEEWKEVLYTPESPLIQEGSDWMFMFTVCEKRGYRIKRDDGGRVFSFVPEADGLTSLANYRVSYHSYGSTIYYPTFLKFVTASSTNKPMFIIKDSFSINVNTNGTYMPKVKHWIDDEGKERVMINTPESLSEFLLTDHEFNREFFLQQAEAYEAGTLDPELRALYEKVTSRSSGRATRAEVELYYRKVMPEYNSNDTEDKGYKVYRYEGWTASFNTHGNKFCTPGDWIIIEGTSANLYFPFQVKSVVHTFSHKWTTDYDLIR